MLDQLALASIVGVALFAAVLCGLVLMIGSALRDVAATLARIRVSACRMQDDCAPISPSIDAMNQHLYGVAAQLAAVGEAAEGVAADRHAAG